MFNDQPANSWEQEHTTRYYAAGNRSLSVGDVVVIGEMTLACRPSGWERVARLAVAQVHPLRPT